MRIEVVILRILGVLLLVAEAWALLNIRRVWKRAQNTNATCGDFEKKIRPYLYTMQIASVCIAVCIIAAVIVR